MYDIVYYVGVNIHVSMATLNITYVDTINMNYTGNLSSNYSCFVLYRFILYCTQFLSDAPPWSVITSPKFVIMSFRGM